VPPSGPSWYFGADTSLDDCELARIFPVFQPSYKAEMEIKTATAME
jgi:hypothetical protein